MCKDGVPEWEIRLFSGGEVSFRDIRGVDRQKKVILLHQLFYSTNASNEMITHESFFVDFPDGYQVYFKRFFKNLMIEMEENHSASNMPTSAWQGAPQEETFQRTMWEGSFMNQFQALIYRNLTIKKRDKRKSLTVGVSQWDITEAYCYFTF